MEKQLMKIREYLILAIIVLFPITIANSFVDQINLPKLIILGLLLSGSLVVFAIEIYTTGQIRFGRGKFDLAVLILLISYLVSALMVTPNKMEAFFLPGTASFVIGAGILYFLINSISDKDLVKKALVVSGALLALITLASFLGVFDKVPQLPAFVKQSSFNPTGDFLTSTIYLAVAGTIGIYFLIKETKLAKKITFAFCLVFILIGLGVSVFSLVSDKKNNIILPPFSSSWAVAVDTIRENPVLGIGPGNYITAFERFRPVSFNNSNFWQLRFSAGRNWYLTVITETGLIGAIGFVILGIILHREAKKLFVKDPLAMGILAFLLITFFLIPISVVSLFLIFIIFALNSNSRITEVNLNTEKYMSLKPIIALLIIALLVFFGIKARPVILAEAKFREASDALAANDGKKTYDSLQSAITLDPLVDRYHASYAQVNLAIAKSIISSQSDPKNLTDDQKTTITQLIQQAIREGQNTVSLNPTRAANWQVLASIYQSIIPYAAQSDSFAIQSYNQTIGLDPTDPNLRIALGGLYYSLGQYDNAINSFQFAILAKPDLANAYYNISLSYAAKNDFNNAIAAMNKVLTLVPKDSSDYKLAQSDLDNLQKKLKTLQESSNSNTLTTPQKQPANTTPIVKLPTEASPPATPISSPTPTPKPTATP